MLILIKQQTESAINERKKRAKMKKNKKKYSNPNKSINMRKVK